MKTTQKAVGWHHPVDDSDQWDGFNEPGIEHFRGNPIVHLAREVNQNASDATEGDAGVVTVKISHREVSVDDIPNVDELRVNLTSCYEASEKEGKKATIFFESALAELKKKKISILEISDYNTRGMKGPSENGSPFYAFMKAKGQSRKESEDAGGSYGIGKFAPYAVSKIRTIFISTVYQDDKKQYVQLSQGKSILMSHDQKGKRKQGVGYWGEVEKCQPIVGVSDKLPKWLQRANSSEELPNSKGSKLTVLCFDATKNWEEHLAVSVAENFFGAIYGGRLRVEIGDNKYLLDQKSIAEFFGNGSIRTLIENEKLSKGEPEQFDNCKNYLTVLRGGAEVWVEESEMQHLGLCQIKILIGEKLPRKVCVLRNGMFITDSLSGLKTFSDFKEFVAVFHCQSKKGNELLRAMEPPRHDDFEPDRLPTKEEQVRGRAALRDISKWVREMLKRHAKDPVSEVTELDELKDFFGDEGDGDTGKGAEEINPYGDVIIRAKPISTRVKVSSADSENSAGDNDGDLDGGGGGLGEGGGDGKGGVGSGDGGSSGGNGKAFIDINNVRAILISNNERKLAFTPIQSGNISVHVKESGADSDYDISIIKADKGAIKNGGVILDVVAGARVVLDIELNQEFSGALKVVAYEI
jgi:uncharacterized membrane protein YgcG